MSTTLRIPAPLKSRLTRLAAAAGTTPHSYMIERLAAAADDAEDLAAFEAEAAKRDRAIDRGAPVLSWEQGVAYVIARLDGKSPRKPRGKPLKSRRP